MGGNAGILQEKKACVTGDLTADCNEITEDIRIFLQENAPVQQLPTL